MAGAATTTLDESTRLLKAFADPVRLRLLSLLSGPGEVCVCHLHEALGLPQPTVSRHLAYLRKHKLVIGRKAGLWVHYQLVRPSSGPAPDPHQQPGNGLGDPEVFQLDRQRLAHVMTCCGES